ncbi:MAG: cyclic nucleotide-binding domain-containing protein [Elusimicrobia bacterium]|nr:cyclic nucleotide-binding domain-containing protein [Elusimicrobiota bacterium]
METVKMSDQDVRDLARILRKVDFFARMTMGELDKILPYVMLCRFAAGDVVFKQGDSGDAFYIVKGGRVGVVLKKGFFSLKKRVAELKAGDFFGEMALLSREKRNATILCEEETLLFVLMSVDFETVMHQNPAFAEEMAKIAERRRFMSSHE